jgi:hypothetical protein
LVSQEWRTKHKVVVNLGHMFGSVLIGVGFYVLFLSFIPTSWGESMWPKISMVVGSVFLVGGIIWQFTSGGNAQTPPPQNQSGDPGATVIENSGGGIGADVSVKGSQGSTIPNIGLETNGLKINQSGPGTGMRLNIDGNGGSAIGVRSSGPVVIGR